MPVRALPAGGVEHPAADLGDQATTLGQLDEDPGRDQATLRMAPAQQRLDAGDALGAQVDQRLIDEEQLVAAERRDEIDLQIEPLLGSGVHAGLKPHPAVLAGALGGVQRQVGVAHQLVRGALERHRDSHAGGHRQRPGAVERRVKRPGERLADPVGDDLGHRVAPERLEQHDELVAAQAPDGVRAAGHAQQAGADLAQQVVAGGMPEAVVDALEAVDVDVQGRHRRLGPPRAQQHLLGAVDDQHPVGQAGERIVQRLVAELALGGDEVALRQELANRDERGQQHRGDQDRPVGQQPRVTLVEQQDAVADAHRHVRRPAGPARRHVGGLLTPGIGRRLRRSGHREQRDRDHPQRVDRIPAVVDGVQRDPAVDEVGGDEEHEAAGHELERSQAGRRRSADQHGGQADQQHHVADRVGDRDRGLQHVRTGLDDGRAEHDVDDRGRAPDRHQRQVEAEPDALAAPARAHGNAQQPDQHDRIEEQVQRVGDRRIGHLALGLVDRLSDVSRQVERGGEREQPPRRAQPGSRTAAPGGGQ